MTRRRALSILRWALYAALFLSAMMTQTVVLANGLFGFSAACVPVAVSCAAMHEGAEKGGAFALAASLVWCLSGASYGSVQIVTLTLAGVLAGGLCQVVLTRRFLPGALLCLGALALNEGVCFALRLYLGSAAAEQALSVLLPSIGVSMLFFPFTYLLAWLIAKLGRAAAPA